MAKWEYGWKGVNLVTPKIEVAKAQTANDPWNPNGATFRGLATSTNYKQNVIVRKDAITIYKKGK